MEVSADFQNLERALIKDSVAVENGVLMRLEAEKQQRIEELKIMIQRVVYQAYSPQVYRRNFNLLRAVNAEVIARGKGTGRGMIDFTLFNDTSLVGRTHPVGNPPPRPEEVPWQIELGQYPDVVQTRRRSNEVAGVTARPWLGPTEPRPAYGIYAEFLDSDLDRWMSQIMDEALQ